MSALQKRLAVAALVSLALCAVSYLPFVREKSAPRAFPTALLNPAHADAVDRIVIGQGGRAVMLERGRAWTATDGETTVRADERLVRQFLERATEIRKMYVISDRADGEFSESVSVSFQDSMNMYTQVYFLGENALTRRVMLVVSSQDAVFETEDDLAPFLQTSVRYWAKPELVQTVDAPTSFAWREPGRAAVVIGAEADGFAQASREVMSLRHGAVVRAEGGGTAAAELAVGGEGAGERIAFIPQGDGSFRCEYVFLGAEDRGLSVAFEISGWTFERLRGTFAGR